jgi:hypothetical protein
MPIDGPAPAVINALRHAGFDLREIPATPERVMAAEKQPQSAQKPQSRRVRASSAGSANSAVAS